MKKDSKSKTELERSARGEKLMEKHYLPCPDCRHRLRRTGKKEKEQKTLEGFWLYTRDYECPSCGRAWIYSETRNLFNSGSLQNQA
jgi:uncharacterized protein with PIN domain